MMTDVKQPERSALIEAARRDLTRGFHSVVIRPGTKRPHASKWLQTLHAEEELERAFVDGFNRGRLLGIAAPPESQAEGYAAVVDLDVLEAVEIGAQLLPTTGEIGGRRTTGETHHFYWTPRPMRSRRFRGADEAMHVELLSQGSQVLVPPSIHPSGEPYVWHRTDPAACIDCSTLEKAVIEVAVATLLIRSVEPSRRESSLIAAGCDEATRTRVLQAIAAFQSTAALEDSSMEGALVLLEKHLGELRSLG